MPVTIEIYELVYKFCVQSTVFHSKTNTAKANRLHVIPFTDEPHEELANKIASKSESTFISLLQNK